MLNYEEALIADIKKFFSHTDKAHDFSHTERVLKTALQLQSVINSDRDVVFLTALLHDVDDKKIVSRNESESNVLCFLSRYSADETLKVRVLDAVSGISFSEGKQALSVESKIVQDADRLDAIGAIGIARTFTYGGSKSIAIYDKEDYCSVRHFHDKLLKLTELLNFEASKKAAKKRHEFMIEFLEQFLNELNCDVTAIN